jgi:hypothetical protein
MAPEQIDTAIFGQALTAGGGQNSDRQTSINAVLPVTLNKV